MKIKVKYHNPICKIESFGDWIDLRAAKKTKLQGPKINADGKVIFNSTIIHLPYHPLKSLKYFPYFVYIF